MTFRRIRFAFTNFSDRQLSTFVMSIINALTGNENYPDVDAYLEEVKKKFVEFQSAIPPRSELNSVNAGIKNVKKQDLIKEMVKLARYVEHASGGDEQIMEASGFPMTAKKQPRSHVGEASGVRMQTNGLNGLLIVSCDSDTNAGTYHARVSVDGVSWNWSGSSRSTSIKVWDCPVNETLFVQVRLENSLGLGPWSKIVQGRIAPDAISGVHVE